MVVNISVIIPTFNRKEALDKCLKALACQDIAGEYEVIVIDDGSTDGTAELMQATRNNYPLSLQYYRQSHRGPAAARNYGIRKASGEILLFIGDDIIAGSPAFLHEHLSWHLDRYKEPEMAVLGYTTWSPELEISPYMQWLETGGAQFSYSSIGSGTFTDFRRFYTSNISLKRMFLGEDLFDEHFPYAAYEDNELGYRLARRGLRIVHNRQALAYHYHPIKLVNYCKRAFLTGKSAVILSGIHPELTKRSSDPNWKRIMKRIMFNSVTMPFWLYIGQYCERRYKLPLLYSTLYSHYFWEGFNQKIKE